MLGIMALVAGVTVIGGVLFGTAAVALGLRGRARAAALGGSADTAVAGLVLGVLGLALAAAVWVWVEDELAEFQGCRKES
ncbi:MAG: DUF4190 domain-containing protein, partial [Actinomycetota bacterium]|nr:DUF4190 domain-containing protein [Actinomycetota bacterium]